MNNSAQPFANIRQRRAVDEIVGQIRTRIQSNELLPGQKLPSERDLSEQFGVSRNTVREALRMLEVSGLITLKKGATGGAFLNASNAAALTQNLLDGISLRQFNSKELFDIRLVLESYVVEQVCLHATDDEIEHLASVAEKSRAAEATEIQWETRLDLHIVFHATLSRLSQNGLAEALMGPLLEITRHFHLKAGPTNGPETHENRAHIVDAIRNRDAPTANEFLRRHLNILQRRIMDGNFG